MLGIRLKNISELKNDYCYNLLVCISYLDDFRVLVFLFHIGRQV